MDCSMPYATSSLQSHSRLATVSVIWSVVYSVAKPPMYAPYLLRFCIQRGFWLAVAYFPFLITCFVSANIAGAMIKHSNWRWGSVYTTLSHYCAETDHHGLFCSVGMFGFIMSSCASLLIVSLFVRQRYLVSRTVNTS